MKDSLLRVPKAGIPSRVNAKNNHRPDPKPQSDPNSDDANAPFSSSPHQISTITDELSGTSSNSVVAAAGDFDEVASNYPALPLLFEDCYDPVILPELTQSCLVEHVGTETENTKEANAATEVATQFDEIVGGGSYAEEISTESSEAAIPPEAGTVTGKWSGKDEGERKLDAVMVRFSKEMEKLSDAIRVLLPIAVDQRTGQGFHSVFFSLSRLGETALACFVSSVLVSFLVSAVSPEGCWNNLLEFNGPSPT